MENPDHVAIGAANFASAYSTAGFAEAWEAAAVGLRSSRAATQVQAASAKAHALQKDQSLPANPVSRAVILAAKKARGEI